MTDNRWRGPNEPEWFEAALRKAERRLYAAIARPELRDSLTVGFRFWEQFALDHALEGLLERITFSGGARGNRYGVAYVRGLRISFNLQATERWRESYGEKTAEAMIVDLVLHEIAHLCGWYFSGKAGHDRAWKGWAKAAGFVPFGRTDEGNRRRRAVLLHIQHEEAVMYGVQKDGAKWNWKCAGCEKTGVPLESREMAREAYRIHRREVCGTEWSPETGIPDPDPITAPSPTRKAAASTSNPKPEKKEPTTGTREINWRIAKVTSPKTGRDLVLEVNRDGSVSPKMAEQIGLSQVDEWYEIRAPTRVLALDKIAKGEGALRKRS